MRVTPFCVYKMRQMDKYLQVLSQKTCYIDLCVNECVNVCVNGALWWIDVPLRKDSCLASTTSLPKIPCVTQLLDTHSDKEDPYGVSIQAVCCFCNQLLHHTAQNSRMLYFHTLESAQYTVHWIRRYTVTRTHSAWNDWTSKVQVNTVSLIITEGLTAGKYFR